MTYTITHKFTADLEVGDVLYFTGWDEQAKDYTREYTFAELADRWTVEYLVPLTGNHDGFGFSMGEMTFPEEFKVHAVAVAK